MGRTAGHERGVFPGGLRRKKVLTAAGAEGTEKKESLFSSFISVFSAPSAV
jgi:hypothetical protein